LVDTIFCGGSVGYIEGYGSDSGRIGPVNAMTVTHEDAFEEKLAEQDNEAKLCEKENFMPPCLYENVLTYTTLVGIITGSEASEIRTRRPLSPTVKTGAASEILRTSATLNATVNPNGEAASECRFEYGSGESYSMSAA